MVSDHNAARYGWIDSWYLLRARWPMLALICSLSLVVGAWIHWESPREFRATVRLSIETPPDEQPIQWFRQSSSVRPASENLAARYLAELTGRDLLGDVVDQCGLAERWGSPAPLEAVIKLRSRIDLYSADGGGIFLLTAIDDSPENAARLANILAKRFVEVRNANRSEEAKRRAERLSRELEVQNQTVADLEARLVHLGEDSAASEEEVKAVRRQLVTETHLLRSLEAKSQLASVEARELSESAMVMEDALPEEAVLASRGWGVIVASLLAGMCFALLATVVFTLRRSSLHVVVDLARRLDLPVVELAPVCGDSILNRPGPPDAFIEPYRLLRTKIHRLQAPDCMLVTCLCDPQDPETSEAVANLGAVFADGGHTVLIVDADFRRPYIHRFFHAASHPGLADYLSGEMRLEETVVKTRRPNLWFMPSGPLPDDPCGMLTGKRMDDLIWNMKQRFDYILFTAPPASVYSDGGAIASLCDHALLITPYRGHSVDAIRKTRLLVEESSGVLSGVLLSRRIIIDPIEEEEGEPEDVQVVALEPAPRIHHSAPSGPPPLPKTEEVCEEEPESAGV